jgi:Major capsid protein Gp23
MSLLTSGQVGNIAYNQAKLVRETVVNRWDSLGFLDGLKGHMKENIATIFENQAGYLMNESTTADSSGSFETVVFPIVRRVFSKLLANEIVSVQAMNMPIGKMFFFVPVISNRVDGLDSLGRPTQSHTTMTRSLPDCVSSACTTTTFNAKNLYDIYYNDGLFDQSKGEITIVAGTAKPVSLTTGGAFISAAGLPLRASTDGTVRNVMIAVEGFSTVNKGRLTGPDGNEMDSESFLASLKIVKNGGSNILDPNGNTLVAANAEVPFRVVTQKYGKGIVQYDDICDANGVLYLELDLSQPSAANGTQTYDGYVGSSAFTASNTTFVASWARYATLENEAEMGEVSFKLDHITVDVQERKLRATWSPELATDVQAFHNIDAEAELTAMLSEQVAAEIDREILKDLRVGAAWTARWDYNGWRKTATASNAYTQKDWNQTLITKVNQVSAQIQKSTLRGGANFLVVSTEIAAIFNDLEYFHVNDASAEADTFNMGIEKVGSLAGRYQVYSDPYSPPNSMIIGHKGKSLLDTGYIYAPYVPLTLTPTMTNFLTFSSVKGIMTRYASKLVNSRFYGHVKVDGVVTFDPRELR